jgi:hypothetical protein
MHMEERRLESLEGVGFTELAPRAARLKARREAREAQRPLVRADGELRVVSVAWMVVGALCVVAAVLLGSLESLSPLEFWATLYALFLPPLLTIGVLTLGRRTPSRMVYRMVLDRAPPPPAGRAPEPARRTAKRAVVAAVCAGFALLPLVALVIALELAVFGKARGEIPNHLIEEATLVDGVWLLVCAAASAQIARWIVRWEEARGRTALCPPLHSGLAGQVYYALGGTRPAMFPEPTPPPARPSRGTGAGSGRPSP